jgi:hypothetical protein
VNLSQKAEVILVNVVIGMSRLTLKGAWAKGKFKYIWAISFLLWCWQNWKRGSIFRTSLTGHRKMATVRTGGGSAETMNLKGLLRCRLERREMRPQGWW